MAAFVNKYFTIVMLKEFAICIQLLRSFTVIGLEK